MNPPVGHGQSFVLTTDLEPNDKLEWLPLGPLASSRWHPTASTLADGTVIVTGHSGIPTGNDRTRQFLGLDAFGAWSWTPDKWNRRNVDLSCPSSPIIGLHHYPRLHLLTSGELIWTDGRESVPFGGIRRHAAYFLPIKPYPADECVGSPDTPWMWHEGLPDPTDPNAAAQKGTASGTDGSAPSIGVLSIPQVGNSGFGFFCSGAPVRRFGWLALSSAGMPTPVPLGGAAAWIDPVRLVALASVTSDGWGWSEVRLPIPEAPGLEGMQVFAQYYWPNTAEPAASNALAVTVQP